MGSKAGQQQTTPAQAALADHAVAQLNDYRQRWLPVQMKLASQIEGEGASGSAERKLAAGKGSTDTAINFQKAQGAIDKTLANAGVAPGSPRANLTTTGVGADMAGSMGLSHLMSDQAIDDAYTQGLGALMSEGQGQRAQVGSNMSTQAAASAAQSKADAEASLMEHEAAGGAIGTSVGFGLQRAGRNGFSNPFAGKPDGAGGMGLQEGGYPSSLFGKEAPGGFNGNNFSGGPGATNLGLGLG